MTYQVKHGDLHHTLVEVGGAVFDDLDGHHFLGLEILALDDLSKGTLAQNVQDEVPVPNKIVNAKSPTTTAMERTCGLLPPIPEYR